jgi:hypothetical protein
VIALAAGLAPQLLARPLAAPALAPHCRYKALSAEDGLAYAVRRVDNVRAPAAVLDSAVRAWARAAHPAIVRLRGITASAAGAGAGALFFAHDYYPGARTLAELYISPGACVTRAELFFAACAARRSRSPYCAPTAPSSRAPPPAAA